MKPRSKEEIRVYNLSKRLRKITPAQLKWGKSLFPGYMYQTKTKTICFECNHTFNHTGDHLVCPNCNSKLVPLPNTTPTGRTRLKDSDFYYFYILTVIEEYQIIRCFRINKHINKNIKPQYYWSEVFRYWIKDSGKVTLMSKNVRPFAYYSFDHWNYSSRVTIKRNYSLFHIIPGVPIYPRHKILPILKRNGYNGQYVESHLPSILKLLLTNPHVETIVKAGYINLLRIQNKSDILRGVKSRPEEFDEYWPQIKMVIRHKYKIDEPNTWFDHLHLLGHIKRDILNIKYVLPDNLNEEHIKLNDLINRRREKEYSKLRRKEESERIKRLSKDAKNFIKTKSKYFDIELHHDKFKIVVLKSLDEFKEETNKLIHCVYNSQYYNKKDSLIMSARINEKPVETIEFSLKEKKVIQSHGIRNEDTELHNEIISFVNLNADRIIRKKEMVKSRKHIKKPVIIDNKFVIDPEWKDPLINESDYDEMEVEEFSYYYNIHLGVPVNNKE